MKRFIQFKARSESGQTMVEYLLLILVTVVTGVILITGPISDFTQGMLQTIRDSIVNRVQHAETETAPITPESEKHPGQPQRLKALHL